MVRIVVGEVELRIQWEWSNKGLTVIATQRQRRAIITDFFPIGWPALVRQYRIVWQLLDIFFVAEPRLQRGWMDKRSACLQLQCWAHNTPPGTWEEKKQLCFGKAIYLNKTWNFQLNFEEVHNKYLGERNYFTKGSINSGLNELNRGRKKNS